LFSSRRSILSVVEGYGDLLNYFLKSVELVLSLSKESVKSVVKNILIATTNPGKMSELQTMLDMDLPWKIFPTFLNYSRLPNTVDLLLFGVHSLLSSIVLSCLIIMKVSSADAAVPKKLLRPTLSSCKLFTKR